MSPAGRRLALLLAVLAVLVVLAGWRYLGLFRLAATEDGSAGRAPAQGARGTSPAEVAAEVTELDLEALQGGSDKYESGRDPWKFVSAPPPPPPGPTPEELERMRQQAAERAAELQARRAAEEEKPKPPPVDMSFLGSFGPAQRKIAVFSDDGEAIYNALVGDVLEGKFIVASIGYESVDLKYVGFPDLPAKRLAVGK